MQLNHQVIIMGQEETPRLPLILPFSIWLGVLWGRPCEDWLPSWAGAPADMRLRSGCCLRVWLCHWVSVAVWSTVREDGCLDFDKDAEWSVVKQQHMYKHTPTQSMCQTVSTGHYRRGKKDWKINSGHPAKAAAVWSHVTTTVSERPRRRASPEEGTFQVHSPLEDTEFFSYSYASYGEHVILTLQEKRICITQTSPNTAVQWSRNRIKVWNEQFAHVVPLRPNEHEKMFCLR